MKCLSSFIGRAKLCALGRRLCSASVLPFMEVYIVPIIIWTWHGLELVDLNIPRSASRANSLNDGESAGKKPPLLSLSRSLSSRLRCSAVLKPHHAGEAYSREATVVSLATSCSSWGRRPCQRRVLKANCDDARDDSVQSVWPFMFSWWFKVTPNTLKVSTRSIGSWYNLFAGRQTHRFLAAYNNHFLGFRWVDFQVVFGRPGLNVVKFFGGCVNHPWTDLWTVIAKFSLTSRAKVGHPHFFRPG